MKEQRLLYKFRKLYRILFFLFLSASGISQETIQIVDDNHLPLIGALSQYQNKQMVSDENGIIVIEDGLKATTKITFSYIACKELTISLKEIRKRKNVVQLEAEDEMLDEIIIIGRTDSRKFELPYSVSRIKASEIYSSHVQTSAEAVKLNGAAYVQKSQMGGGSPILRGFEANKILLVVDGVRMNNAIYRNGHLQNAITVDPAILQQVELLYGPASLMYGSDALGGVIHFRTKSPLLNYEETATYKQSLTSHIRYNSANQEKRIHLDHMFSGKKFGVLTSISGSDYDNLRSGKNQSEEYEGFGLRNKYVSRIDGQDVIMDNDDPYTQIGTAYKQIDLLQKWVFKLSPKINLDLNLQYSSSGDVPRYDNLIEQNNGTFKYAEWHYGPQKRLLISPRLSFNAPTAIYDKLIVITSFQDIKEERVSRLLNVGIRESQREDVNVMGFSADFQKRLTNTQSISYGIDAHHNEVSSSAFHENILTQEKDFSALTRYPSGGSSMTNFGVYMQHNWKNQDSTFNWINGLRWNYQEVELRYSSDDPIAWPAYFYDGIESEDRAVVGMTAVNYEKGDFSARLITGTAFRSPNVDDLAKIRINSNEITVPNPELESENVWNSELSLVYEKRGFKIGFTAYYTSISEAIIREPFQLPDSSSIFISNNDTLLVTGNVNAETGTVKGISVHIDIDLNHKLNLFSSISFQKGNSENEAGVKVPLGHIPPTYAFTKLSYEEGPFNFQLLWRYNGWKRIEDFGGSVDNPDLATIDGSPSWSNYSFNTMWTINRKASLSLAVNNILDRHYRPFSSGLSAPGRHLSASFRYLVI